MTTDHARTPGRIAGRALAALTLACAGASTALTGAASAASAATSPAPPRTVPQDPRGLPAARTGAINARAAATLRAPSCRDVTFRGPDGRIHVRTSPSHTIAWGIYMNDPGADAGSWEVDVLIDGNRVDHKTQAYPPHASLPASRYRGRTFSLKAVHTDLKGRLYHQVPNGCIIP
ncbi:hypothetical protein [Actinomadura sp. NEAU-AAG7]|uniref:hypothetical protein n=1 Tax=Actinomadura sp. NEAU-AAG7 TaxID=2839640 RepID=UPI001BE47FE7|nr:hypothetical protein [Actinomadura sp. NEAU-AAG7]MBT2212578.1 hypothetical protein [Actinomadura sp. NEAU-AAG7]